MDLLKEAHSQVDGQNMIISIIIFVLGASKLRVYLLLFQVSILRLCSFPDQYITFFLVLYLSIQAPVDATVAVGFLSTPGSHLLLTSNQIAVLVSINQNRYRPQTAHLTIVCHLVNNATLNQSSLRGRAPNRIQTITEPVTLQPQKAPRSCAR